MPYLLDDKQYTRPTTRPRMGLKRKMACNNFSVDCLFVRQAFTTTEPDPTLPCKKIYSLGVDTVLSHRVIEHMYTYERIVDPLACERSLKIARNGTRIFFNPFGFKTVPIRLKWRCFVKSASFSCTQTYISISLRVLVKLLATNSKWKISATFTFTLDSNCLIFLRSTCLTRCTVSCGLRHRRLRIKCKHTAISKRAPSQYIKLINKSFIGPSELKRRMPELLTHQGTPYSHVRWYSIVTLR